MYQKPTLQRFGTFRDLTRIGCGADGDAGIIGFLDGRWATCFERDNHGGGS